MKKMGCKIAIVTGSSRGIGFATAKKLAKNNIVVVLNSRNQNQLIEAKNHFLSLKLPVDTCEADVSTEEGAKKLIEFVFEKYQRIDILINNVGISSRGSVADTSPAVYKKVFESNVYGSIFPTIFALPIIRQYQGSIVFISSVAGIRGLPLLASYSSSKMALRAFAESIRLEEANNKIHVGLILVGVTEIDSNKTAIAIDGSEVLLLPRENRKVLKFETVADAVFENIKSRRFITTMTSLGKLNAFLQARFPMLVEKIIMRNMNKFHEGNK